MLSAVVSSKCSAMAVKTVAVLCTLILGCLAAPVIEDDLWKFFDDGASPRIVGGTVAAPGSHPSMVAMTDGTRPVVFLCGGSILSQRTVLTAAHCIVHVRGALGSLSRNLRLTVGTNRWNQGGQSLTVNAFAIHPQYNANQRRNDLGVFHTASVIAFSSIVRPITLGSDFVGARVSTRVAGWGRDRANGAFQSQLMEITVPTVDGDWCVREVRERAAELGFRNVSPVDPAVHICTFHSVGRGTCNGDSGSPLVNVQTGQQVGLVSWGLPCALGAPDMHVRISAVRSWIQQNIRQ